MRGRQAIMDYHNGIRKGLAMENTERYSNVEGEVFPSLLKATGRTFRGRDVVIMTHIPGLFGTNAKASKRERELTIANGIVNQCSISDPPTPYWAVMDAICVLKSGFTKRDVINKAVQHVGEGKRKACLAAWDVLRNHHRHERKRSAGMGFMIDTLAGGKMNVRARESGETMAYFMGERDRRMQAEALLAEVDEENKTDTP